MGSRGAGVGNAGKKTVTVKIKGGGKTTANQKPSKVAMKLKKEKRDMVNSIKGKDISTQKPKDIAFKGNWATLRKVWKGKNYSYTVDYDLTQKGKSTKTGLSLAEAKKHIINTLGLGD